MSVELLRHGQASAKYTKGARDEGRFKCEQRWGCLGDLSKLSLCQHHGHYTQCRHGSAKYTNGGRYEGDFKCEHRWGWGRHVFHAGDHYEGQWVDDKIQGRHSLCPMSYVVVRASSKCLDNRICLSLLTNPSSQLHRWDVSAY